MITPVLIMDKFPDFKEPGFNIDRYNQRFYNSNVVIRASANNVEYGEHWGPLSVKCAFNGEEHYRANDSHYAVDDHHFLVFNRGKTYSSWIESPRHVNSLTLNIAPHFEQTAVRSIMLRADQLLDDPVDHNTKAFRFTERLYKHNGIVSPVVKSIADRSNEYRIDELFYQLMEGLLQLQANTNAEIERVDKMKASTRVEIFERLLRARDFIHSSYRDNISLDDIAEVACMNKFYFLRQFRKVFKITPHQYLTERRMQVASSLLTTTDIPVTDVCCEVGFSDLSSFGKLYRRHYGVAPSDLRM